MDRTWDGAGAALDIIAANLPGAVLLNIELLDRIADNIPEFADRVADIRARAAEALAPETADEPPAGWRPRRPTNPRPTSCPTLTSRPARCGKPTPSPRRLRNAEVLRPVTRRT